MPLVHAYRKASLAITTWLSHLRRSSCPRVILFVFLFTSYPAVSSPSQSSTNAPCSTQTVWNGERGLWDGDPDRSFALKEDMVVGVAEGDKDYILGRIFDVATNSAGAIYVLDNGYVRVQKYDSSGVYQQTIGRQGEGPGEFSFPLAIAVDESDNIYVADRIKISIFDAQGDYVDEFRHGFSGGFPRSIRISKNKDIYISCFDVLEQQIIHRYNSNHEKVRSFCDSYSIGQEIDVRIEQSFAGGAIDIGQDGLIYFTQRHPYEIRVFLPDGELFRDVYRENSFVQEPIVAKGEGGLTFGLPTSATAIIVLNDNRFVNVLKNTDLQDETTETIIDLFDSQGTLLTSHRVEKLINLRCVDSSGRLYGFDATEYPRVVRYRISYN